MKEIRSKIGTSKLSEVEKRSEPSKQNLYYTFKNKKFRCLDESPISPIPLVLLFKRSRALRTP